METEWLRTFLVAAKTENFGEAAEKRFLTQSTVTKHIHHLEKELKTLLFERSGKKVRLNIAGAYFFGKAEKLIEMLDDSLRSTQDFLEGYTSNLTIGVAPQIANSTLPRIIEHFNANKPHIQLSIELLNSNEIAEAAYRGAIDIGLSKIETTRDLQIEMIADESIQLVISPSRSEVEPAELLKSETILTHEYAPYWEAVQHVLISQFPSHKSMKVNQTEVIKNFVKQGLGIAFLPQSIVQKEGEEGTLCIRSLNLFQHITSQTYFISKYISSDIQAFLESSKEIYTSLPDCKTPTDGSVTS
ncbi:LysR family transcriptional regulator [Rummeliibacillus pycnus]|uniref:LysR family transcriptional regulator n=1 Tax=Rummeliibacillus pycnus TaxID=101070 RepID=UPI0037CB2D53